MAQISQNKYTQERHGYFMKKFILLFTSSAKEFKNLNSIITAALLVAVHTILAMVVSVQVTTSLRISLSFITNVVTGCLFGPVIGFVCGGIGDIVQFILKPVGDYFPGWTLNAAMAGMIYGIFFYNKFPDKVNVKKISSKKDNNTLHTNDETENKAKRQVVDSVFDIFSILLPSIGLLFLCFAPMATVTDKNDGSIIAQGNGLYYMMSGFTQNSKNVTIIAIILAVLMISLIILSIFHLNILSLILSVACTFAAILAIYTDKKTTVSNWGFYFVVGLMILFVIVKMIMLQRKHAVDMSYFIRVAICLTCNTVLVNILMGTYWASIMYGKGFMFYFTVRMAKNLIQLPINIVLSYYILSIVKGLRLRSSKA